MKELDSFHFNISINYFIKGVLKDTFKPQI